MNVTLEVNVYWPLYTIYPGSTVFFWALYLFIAPWASKRWVVEYECWTLSQQKVWRQTIAFLLHSWLLVVGLVCVLAIPSEGEQLRHAGLLPHYSAAAYADVCLSLGYMSFTLPWSIYGYFWLKQRDLGTNKGLILHHTAVVVAELVYLLTQTSPWYGALALVLFEVSNLNGAPHMLMTQKKYSGIWHLLNGLMFLVTFTGSRVIACTVVGAFYIKDYVEMQSSDVGIWVMVGVSLVCYCILMGLSYMWFRREVMTVAHFELKRYFGQHCARAGSEPAPLVMSYSRPTQGVLLGALWQITCVVAPRVSRPS